MEEWRDIPNWEGIYQASSYGKIRSLDREIVYSNGARRIQKGKILKPVSQGGYYSVQLNNKGYYKSIRVHQLVAMAFLGHKRDGTLKIVVDHIDGDIYNNHKDNLQLISQRENATRNMPVGKYGRGVSFKKNTGKYEAYIGIDGKTKYLGSFSTKEEAQEAYQRELNKIIRPH